MTLRAENISRQFTRETKNTNIFTAVHSVDFALREGALTVITGRSGSGKSTFMNMLSGLLVPTEGKIYFGEEELYALSDEKLSKLRNEHFGFVPQGQSGISSLTVWENVLLPYTLFGDNQSGKEYAEKLLSLMDIADLKNVYPTELSGGELRRMSIARALIRRPQIVFADEPTGDLDDENTAIVLKLFKQIAKEGVSVLLVTHENEAKMYADVAYRMSGGVLQQEKEVYNTEQKY
ncbi:MAG: ABC transporter ATP-binding protein [Lachnospiraceae bacterium]|nr:ABC transporter ATP-binding protein [Lachnospiraceae bacterium]